MAEQTVTLFDCETGGLNEKENPITEIAMLNFDLRTFKVNWEFSTFVKPYDGLVIDPVSLEKTMVTMKDVENGMDKKKLLKEIIKRLKASNCANGRDTGNTDLAGHNIISFDRKFMEYLFTSEGENLYDYVGVLHDTYAMAKSMWAGDGKKLNLTDCCKRIGVKLVGAHGAMPDVRANFELFKYLVESQRSNTKNYIAGVADKKPEGSPSHPHRKFFNF